MKGKRCYLYRAIDRDGNLVDSMLSEKRDMDAAKRFFQQALQTVGHAPERVTTDGHDSYPRAIREILGNDVLHRCNHYLNNRLEPGPPWDQAALLPHAWVRETSRLPHGFAERPDELRQFFRFRTTMKQKITLGQQRDLFRQRLDAMKGMVAMA